MLPLNVENTIRLDATRLQSNAEYGRRSDSWMYFLRYRGSLERMRMLRSDDLGLSARSEVI